MKRNHLVFNKKSRLITLPELTDSTTNILAPFNESELRRKLPELLKTQNDFYPCFDWTFPPPLINTSSPPEHVSDLFSKQSIIPGRYSIYLHSPFCKSLCSFCYYSVIPEKGIDLSEDYVNHLIKEMSLYRQHFIGQTCESIYFGGGTPSYLDDTLLARIFDALYENFNVCDDAEITIESAPGTLSEGKCNLLKDHGVNRVSYGIQTLDEELLSSMNRNYSVEQAINELTNAIDVFGNVNIDTMYGFPHEKEGTLIKTLKKFYEIGVPSFSIYSLDQQRSSENVKYKPPKDELYENKIRQFSEAEYFLKEIGYTPVLQNIFIDPTRASYRHQLRRWDNLPLIGMGLNSQGYAPQTAYQNTASLNSYYKMIDEGQLPISTVDLLDPELELCRELTSKLRFTYINLKEIKFKYNVSIKHVFYHLIEVLTDLGHIEHHGEILRMTEKSVYYNNIIPMLFAPDKFKQKLMGLPHEYLEAFPVPYIITKLGNTQSEPFYLNKNNKPGIDRRSSYDRRTKIKNMLTDKRQSQSGRRSTDTLNAWRATQQDTALKTNSTHQNL